MHLTRACLNEFRCRVTLNHLNLARVENSPNLVIFRRVLIPLLGNAVIRCCLAVVAP